MIRLMIIGLLALFLQIVLADSLIFFGFLPNFLISYIILVVLYRKIDAKSIWLVFLIGLGYDIFNPSNFGLNALAFLLVFYITEIFFKFFSIRSKLSVILSVIIANITHLIVIFFSFFC